MKLILCSCSFLLALLVGGPALSPAAAPAEAARQQARKALDDGNFKEAYEGFRKLALDPEADPGRVGDHLNHATQCLQRLNRVDEMDALREAVVDVHSGNWRLLQAAAQNWMSGPHHGYIVAGEFQRGDKRGGGQLVNSRERDRVRALQLMAKALPLVREDGDRGAVGSFFFSLAGNLLNNRGHQEAWRLQYLTDLDELPDYEPGWGYYRGSTGAPVDAEGNPVYHQVPESFEASTTDGERWRWCLQQAMELNPARKHVALLQFADFLQSQFGVQTLATYGWRFGRGHTDDTQDDESGTYALHTLKNGETIARLASGVRRFSLPDEFNHLKVLRAIVESGSSNLGWQAVERLAGIYENRRQYPEAAEWWRRRIRDYPQNSDHARERLDQIIGNWGRFEPVLSQPAGTGATVEYRFRNGDSVKFTATEVKVPLLLEDVKAYIKKRPPRLDWNEINIGNVGYRLVNQNQEKYLGDEVARWSLRMKPREDHFDDRETVTTPLQKPGAYLLTATMVDGNTSHIIIWLSDTAIVKKPLDGSTLYYVADTITGKPVSRANLEFFGYRQKYQRGNRYEILIEQFAEFSDADGQVVPDARDHPAGYQWIVTARTDEGRFAYLGFTGTWYGQRHDAEYRQTKVFSITDRPVYRPGHTVNYKFWVRHARYDKEDTSDFAGQSFTLEIHDARGNKVVNETVKADAYGGLAGKLELASDATLGAYSMVVKQGNSQLGGGSFRVEEYKKPEFEVLIEAPEEPVMLGEKIEATIRAKYYFGSPVTRARVKYKVLRTSHSTRWYPYAPWDWLYGSGYWWYAYDYDWYPGFGSWGCRRPIPFWWPRGFQPPEVVAEHEVEIGPQGTVKVEIDTEVAKVLHPDEDHRYSITAEVVDASRRTIVGTGEVLVARKPFKVYAWVDRGYYRTGDTIRAGFCAKRPDSKPVQGQGKLRLLRITYEDNQPVESVVQTWSLETDVEGRASQQIEASRAGQYRLSYAVTDAAGHEIQGGYVFTIIGQGFDGSEFRFNHVEIIPGKKEYAPGETVKLQINTDRTGSTVLLFLRPTNGVYLPPEILRLEGKSTVHEVAVVKKDMPNFFVEAVTIADGEVHSETREIVVPPEKRVLSVEIDPSSETYKPGEKAKVRLKLTDFDGEPFQGSTVVAIYDKSVEYISGGSNVPAIKPFFWKWRRHHSPRSESSLEKHSGNLVPPGRQGMRDIGVFGGTVVEDLDSMTVSGGTGLRGGASRNRFGVRASKMVRAESAALAPGAGADFASDGLAVAEGAAVGGEGGGAGGGAAETEVQPTVRTEFADTALWLEALETGKDGTTEVALDMPENLTTWKIRVWGMGHGTRVGEGTTEVVTRKDLILRLQAPRFFVEKDEVVLSANVHNYLESSKSVRVALELEGGTLEPLDEPSRRVEIEPEGEARVDWRVKVTSEGEAVVRMLALTDEESDAMEMRFPCKVHGMLKMESWSGAIRPDEKSGGFTVRVPEERRPEQSRLEVRYSPTLAGALVDALPYLVNYPYGCTEQTLNRFLPTVITRKILLDMGLDLEDIRKKRANLNAQEIGDDRERAKGWKRYDRNPVFDETEVVRMVKDGVKRLTEMQLSDGGWGWFSGWGEHSYAHTTAYVVHGLQIAVENDVALVPGVIEKGVAWLERYQKQQLERLENALKDPKKRPWKEHADNLDAFVYMVLVDAGVESDRMLEFLYRDRTKIAVYSLAMFGIALEKQGEEEKLDMVMQNISQYLVQDDENQTAWLNLPGGYWWYWYGSENEAHAYYLKLLARTDPGGEIAPRLVKYLLNNRKHATYWSSTRDTALCIEAMADFLRASGEDKPEMTVQVWLDGKLQKAVEITPDNLFVYDNKFVIEGKEVTAGEHGLELRKEGRGPLYFNGYLTNFTLEDFITRAGLEVKVSRSYYRLEKVDATTKVPGSRGQALDQKVEKYERKELENLATLESGDLVEVELTIESKNDYEYLVFEDFKPAGFEAVDQRSGYNSNPLGAYVEYRDDRVVFFVRLLARGKHSVAYRMRAEIPGKFSALPTKAWAMYAPELKGNSDEIKLEVED